MAIEGGARVYTIHPLPQTERTGIQFFDAENSFEQQDRDHAQYMEERKGLIDAVREDQPSPMPLIFGWPSSLPEKCMPSG